MSETGYFAATIASTACVSQGTNDQNPWIIGSGASNHISAMWYKSNDWVGHDKPAVFVPVALTLSLS